MFYFYMDDLSEEVNIQYVPMGCISKMENDVDCIKSNKYLTCLCLIILTENGKKYLGHLASIRKNGNKGLNFLDPSDAINEINGKSKINEIIIILEKNIENLVVEYIEGLKQSIDEKLNQNKIKIIYLSVNYGGLSRFNILLLKNGEIKIKKCSPQSLATINPNRYFMEDNSNKFFSDKKGSNFKLNQKLLNQDKDEYIKLQQRLYDFNQKNEKLMLTTDEENELLTIEVQKRKIFKYYEIGKLENYQQQPITQLTQNGEMVKKKELNSIQKQVIFSLYQMEKILQQKIPINLLQDDSKKDPNDRAVVPYDQEFAQNQIKKQKTILSRYSKN